MTKLSLNRETLKSLSAPGELADVNGGRINIKTLAGRCISFDLYTCIQGCASAATTCAPPSYAC